MKVILGQREAQFIRDAGYTIPEDAYDVSRDDFTPEEIARANALAESLGWVSDGGEYDFAEKRTRVREGVR